MNDMTHPAANAPHNQPSPPAFAKASLAPGGALSALVPQSLDDAFRLSKALAASGDMVPKHFQNSPETVMAAVLRGMEIGLAPMQALSNIAVINGRASLWGDALPALMQRAGHHIDVDISGEGDQAVAVARLTRGDSGKVIERSFSMADAKRANLAGKAGPWQQYPKRMLAHRARAWACRDGAADALMGLQVAEEAQDFEAPRDVTPKTGGFSSLAQRARAPQSSQIEHRQPTPEDEDQTHADPDYADVDTSEAFPGSDEWEAGVKARQEGDPLAACPFDDEEKVINWVGGWKAADAHAGDA